MMIMESYLAPERCLFEWIERGLNEISGVSIDSWSKENGCFFEGS